MQVDFNYFLGRKYAAQEEQNRIAAQNARTNAVGVAATANLDNVRASVIPKESMANIDLTRANAGERRANTNLITEQARVIGPEAFARIRSLDAGTESTQVGTQIARREGLTERRFAPGSLGSVLNGGQLPTITSLAGGGGGYSLTTPMPRRRAGESEAAYLDRVNGF